MDYYRIVRNNADGTRNELEIVAGRENAERMAADYSRDYQDRFSVVPYPYE